jgi:hypothetical protein
MTMRARLIATMSGLLLSAIAGAGDLVDHNGFEACWSKAITVGEFTGLMQSSIEGQTTCVAQSSGSCGPSCTFTACNTAACPGGATGCPVTLHSGAFGGDLGTGIYAASGTADNISVPLSYVNFGVPGSCTITATGITLGYTLGYTLQPDGNSGLYAASLDQSLLDVTGYAAGSATPACNALAASLGASFVQQVEAIGATFVSGLETPATVEQAVCPLQ